ELETRFVCPLSPSSYWVSSAALLIHRLRPIHRIRLASKVLKRRVTMPTHLQMRTLPNKARHHRPPAEVRLRQLTHLRHLARLPVRTSPRGPFRPRPLSGRGSRTPPGHLAPLPRHRREPSRWRQGDRFRFLVRRHYPQNRTRPEKHSTVRSVQQ